MKKYINKKIIALMLILFFCIGCLCEIGYIFLSQDATFSNDVTSSEYITVYIQNLDTGDYEVSTTGEFPTEGYELDEELSSCKNGTEVYWNDALSDVVISSTGSDQCNLYFKVYENTLYRQILFDNAEYESSINLDASSVASAIALIDAKGAPSYTSLAEDDEGMYGTVDVDGGTSYYFRGAVTDNWVYFADAYWRIIRIDEYGNVKMIYAGTSVTTSDNGATSTDATQNVGNYPFYDTSTLNSAYFPVVYTLEGAGYVYETNQYHGTSTASDAKKTVDSWYSDNLESIYGDYIAETSYCIDRTLYTSLTASTSMDDSSNYNDYKYESLYFGALSRVYYYRSKMTLQCANAEDILYLSVGLINAEEVGLAGGKLDTSDSNYNSSYYLYTGFIYWTISPASFNTSDDYVYSYVIYMNSTGAMKYYSTNASLGIRPTISLSSDVIYSEGNGTSSDPYKISISS